MMRVGKESSRNVSSASNEEEEWFIFPTQKWKQRRIDIAVTHLTFDRSLKVIPKAACRNDCFALLESIKIPKTVKKIGQEAFFYCQVLEKVDFQDGCLATIDKRAFQGCVLLREIAIPNTVQAIGSGAFQDCRALVNVTLPSGLKVLKDSTFRGCTSLIEVDLPRALINVEQLVFWGCTSLQTALIPFSVMEIGQSAFGQCHSLTFVELPRGLKKISSSAFSGCELLKDIALPSCVEEIEPRAFHGCQGLVKIQFAKDPLPSGLKVLGESAFLNCSGLIEIDLPNSLSRIENNVFYGCTSLQKAKIPDSVVYIGSSAFAYCHSLTVVELPKGLKKIQYRTFASCELLSGIVLPDGLEKIEDHAFHACEHLLGVEIAMDCNVKIDRVAFTQCPWFVNVSVPWEMFKTKGISSSIFASFLAGSWISPRTTSASASSQVDIDPFPDIDQLRGEDAIQHVRDRFAKLPIHRFCYHASVTTVDQLTQALETCSDLESTDYLGMTPFHIVATSANPRIDILKCLLSRHPVEVLTQKDRARNRTMMDYLLVNGRGATALQMVLGIVFAQAPSSKVVWRGEAPRHLTTLDLKDQIESLAECDMDGRFACVRKIFERVGFQTEKEMAVLLELASWKRRLHEDVVDRDSCRYQCGAQVVVENVLEYLMPDESNYLSEALTAYPYCTIIPSYPEHRLWVALNGPQSFVPWLPGRMS